MADKPKQDKYKVEQPGKAGENYEKNQANRAGKAVDNLKADPNRAATRDAIMGRKPPVPIDPFKDMEGLGPKMPGGTEPTSPIRIIVDEAGKVSHIDPATGKVSEVSGNFRKLVDIFDELAGKAKQAVGGAVDTAKGLLAPGPKTIPTGNAALGRGSATLAKKGLSTGAKVAIGGAATGGVGLAAATLLELMQSNPAGEGEDQKLAAMAAADEPEAVDNPREEALEAQTSEAMDKGINPAARPTMEPEKGPNPRPSTDVGAAMPQAATMVDNHTGKLGGVQTKGGFYPTFDKSSTEAKDFRSTFAQAVASKAPTFMWQGREYTTELK